MIAKNQRDIHYHTEDGHNRIKWPYPMDMVWFTTGQMSGLFKHNKSTISRRIRNVFEYRELKPDSVVAFFATVQNDDSRKVGRSLAYCNLDVIHQRRLQSQFPPWGSVPPSGQTSNSSGTRGT